MYDTYDWRFAFSELQIGIEVRYGRLNETIIHAFICMHVYMSTA